MLSNYDHDRRARRDLRGNDLFRYENGLMSKGELSALEAKYHGEDETERLRQEGEKYWQEYYNSTFDSGSTNSSTNSTNSDSSYYSGGYHSSNKAKHGVASWVIPIIIGILIVFLFF